MQTQICLFSKLGIAMRVLTDDAEWVAAAFKDIPACFGCFLLCVAENNENNTACNKVVFVCIGDID